MNLDFDLHVHTFHSPCGKPEMVPTDIVRVAVERGLTRLAITDHFYPFTDPGIFDDIRTAVAETEAVRNNALKVYFGAEVEIMSPGKTAGSPELAEGLDFVMAGASHFQNKGITELPAGLDDRDTAEYVLKIFEYAVSLPWVDVIAHPFFVIPSICPATVYDCLQDAELLEALELARENKVAMEISRRIFHTEEHLRFAWRFYPLCKKAGLKFSIGSDAHRLEDIGNVHILEPFLEEINITEKDIRQPE